jgi:hypothetical protein
MLQGQWDAVEERVAVNTWAEDFELRMHGGIPQDRRRTHRKMLPVGFGETVNPEEWWPALAPRAPVL